MARRDVAIEIIQPTLGLHTEMTPSMIDQRSTPNCSGANAYFGMVQKDYGTTLFATGTDIGAPTNLIYEANFQANAVLQVFSQTNMFKYLSGTYANDGQTYSGSFTDVWRADMHNNALIYANGQQLIQYKADVTSTGTNMAGIITSSYKAWDVESFANHLNLYHTWEGGTESPKRVRWSKIGALGYTDTDWSEGTANFIDIQDMNGSLMCATKLGAGAVVIWGENSIHMQEWVGGWDVYKVSKYLSNYKIASRRGAVAHGNVIYFVTDENVYEYHGWANIRPIGDAMKRDYLTYLNNAALAYSFIQYVRDDDELRVYVPTGTSTQPNMCYICKVRDNYAWYKKPVNYCSVGVSTRDSAVTIGDLQGNIGAQNWRFGDMFVRAGSPTYLLGDTSGRVNQMDKTVYSIVAAGTTTPKTFLFDSKELSSVRDIDPLLRNKYALTEYMDNVPRWSRAVVEAKGQGRVYLQYSTDGGSTFIPVAEEYKTLSTEWEMHEFDIDQANESLMLRVINTATNEVVHMRYMKAEFVPGAEE